MRKFTDSRFFAPMATMNIATAAFPAWMQRIGQVLNLFAPGPSHLHIGSYVIPTSPGRCRIITHATRNFMKVPLPRWWSHIRENRIFEGDAVMLYKQQSILDAARPYRHQITCPTTSDRAVMAFRHWLEHFGNHGPWGKTPPPRRDVRLSKRALLERKTHHTDICGSCRAAYAQIERGQGWSAATRDVAMTAAVGAAAMRQAPLALACAGIALLSSAIGARLAAARQGLDGFDHM